MLLRSLDDSPVLMPWVIKAKGYDPNQPRAEDGKWSDGGAGAGPAGEGTLRTRNFDEAVQALAGGRAVELETAEDAYTLVDRMYEFTQEAQAKGEKAPNLDLCSVSVPGTNLFCGDNIGIERAEMPQLSGQPRPGSPADSLPKNDRGEVNIGEAFTDRLSEMGVDVSDQTVPAASLRASQKELVGANVAWMMNNGEKIGLSEGRIFVSSDGYVIDGHHRWAALVSLDARDGGLGDVPINVQQIGMPISQVLQFANEFADEIGVMPKAAKRRVPLGVRAYMTW